MKPARFVSASAPEFRDRALALEIVRRRARSLGAVALDPPVVSDGGKVPATLVLLLTLPAA
jgi:hypothetical protein